MKAVPGWHFPQHPMRRSRATAVSAVQAMSGTERAVLPSRWPQRALCMEMNGSAAPDIAVSRINVSLLSHRHMAMSREMDGNAIQHTARTGMNVKSGGATTCHAALGSLAMQYGFQAGWRCLCCAGCAGQWLCQGQFCQMLCRICQRGRRDL